MREEATFSEHFKAAWFFSLGFTGLIGAILLIFFFQKMDSSPVYFEMHRGELFFKLLRDFVFVLISSLLGSLAGLGFRRYSSFRMLATSGMITGVAALIAFVLLSLKNMFVAAIGPGVTRPYHEDAFWVWVQYCVPVFAALIGSLALRAMIHYKEDPNA